MAATGATSAALLSGCLGGNGDEQSSGSGDQSGETATDADATETPIPQTSLSLAGWAADDTESELLKQRISDFESTHDNIDVSYSAVQAKYKQKLKTQLGAGNAPDVFYVDANYFGSFAANDVLLSLDELEADQELDTDDFFEPLIDAFRHDGSLYGVPKDFSTLGLFYNTELFDQAGVEAPETWSELKQALAAVAEKTDVKAPMMEYGNARMWKALLYQNGGQMLSDDESEAVFASDEGVEALEYMLELRDEGLLATPDELGAGWHGAGLGTEEIAAAIIGPWTFPFLAENHPEVDEKIDVAHLPIPEGGQKATSAYTVSYSVAYNTDSPAASRELIKGLTSSEGMQKWAEQGLALSARKSHQSLQFYEDHPRYKTLLEAGEWSVPVAYGPNSEALLNRLHPELEGAMLGQQSAEAALTKAQEKINTEVF
ncbi:ABC transporter substrate-binding protein [Haloferax marisrubri]|nr:ABC transporter substrate-binding protein [Haloferax marisrubri]